MGSSAYANRRTPTAQQIAWAKATLRYALRTEHIDLDEYEDRLGRVLAAGTYDAVHHEIADLPHPPAPLSIDDP